MIPESRKIEDLRSWFEEQSALGRSVNDMANDLKVERHRIIFALNKLGLTAKGLVNVAG